MDAAELRAMQAPIKERYKSDPSAAVITLKLVAASGGEALANTQWSVLTPGGDVVKEAIGAFPKVVLAEGEYSVVAKNDDKTFNGKFKVEPGVDREIEVLAR